MNDKEFMKLLSETCNGKHCSAELIKMARTKWQKQVAVEFVLQDRKISKQGQDITTLKKISWGIFTVTFVAAAIQLITQLF